MYYILNKKSLAEVVLRVNNRTRNLSAGFVAVLPIIFVPVSRLQKISLR